MNYPGGIVEYISAFLSQFLIFPVFGAVIIGLVIVGIMIGFYLILVKFSGLSLIGSIVIGALLLVMHSSYFYELDFSIALLITIWNLWLYLKI